MSVIRLGAVSYLNARPLVFRLERAPRFSLRFDLPAECARLLRASEIDLGLIPSIEYCRADDYRIVPGLAIASRGAVTSVALYTTRPIADVQSIAMDTSSRTSVALVHVLCDRLFRIQPRIESEGPDLETMLASHDAALVIGDNALLWDHTAVHPRRRPAHDGPAASSSNVEKIDLGETWTSMTGLPFVWAFWAGRPGVVGAEDVRTLQAVRDENVVQPLVVSEDFFQSSPEHVRIGERYLRDNIKYYLDSDERAGLELFYRYAAELGLVPAPQALRFF
jgi:chorismate dehydratase